MFQKLKQSLRDMMIGRYGQDQLGSVIFLLGLGFMILSMIFGRFLWSSVFSFLSWAALIWCIIRMFSRNIAARSKENKAFLNFLSRLRDKEHRYYRCPQCRQIVRVPRGRGKINIRCPRCNRQFIKKT